MEQRTQFSRLTRFRCGTSFAGPESATGSATIALHRYAARTPSCKILPHFGASVEACILSGSHHDGSARRLAVELPQRGIPRIQALECALPLIFLSRRPLASPMLRSSARRVAVSSIGFLLAI